MRQRIIIIGLAISLLTSCAILSKKPPKTVHFIPTALETDKGWTIENKYGKTTFKAPNKCLRILKHSYTCFVCEESGERYSIIDTSGIVQVREPAYIALDGRLYQIGEDGSLELVEFQMTEEDRCRWRYKYLSTDRHGPHATLLAYRQMLGLRVGHHTDQNMLDVAFNYDTIVQNHYRYYVKNNNKWGLLKRGGTAALDMKYDWIYDGNMTVVHVVLDGISYMVNLEMPDKHMPVDSVHFLNGSTKTARRFVRYAIDGAYGYGTEVEEKKAIYSDHELIFYNGDFDILKTTLRENGKFHILTINGEPILKGTFDEVEYHSLEHLPGEKWPHRGYFITRQEKKYDLYRPDGRKYCDISFDSIKQEAWRVSGKMYNFKVEVEGKEAFLNVPLHTSTSDQNYEILY